MSRISLTPNASGTGTFTIAAPNSDTDRTLTLPDTTGTVLTSAGGTMSGTYGFGGFVSLQTSDVNGYPRINGSSASAQLGLFRSSGGTEGGMYVGGDGGQFSVWSSDFQRRLNVSQAGIVTMPYQPAFVAYNAPASLVAGSTIVWSSTALNRGSVYNTSNGRFTAPVSGLYQFFASVRVESGIANTSYHRLTFLHNGSQIQWSLSRLNFHLNGYFSHASNDQVVAMSAGDYVEVKFESSPSPITTGAPNEHIFYGYLIG